MKTTETPHGKKWVLVVDDDEGLRELILRTLERHGFAVRGAARGSEAVELAVAAPPVLMLLDYRLPDMTGQALVAALAERGLAVPFVMMTGQGNERLAVEMMKLGATDYLIKDTELVDRLPAVVERTLREAEVKAQLRAAEEALRRHDEKMTVLNLVGRKVGQSLLLEDVAREASAEIRRAARADLAFIFMRDGERLVLKGVAPAGGEKGFEGVPEHRVGECMCGLAVKQGRTLCSRNIFTDSRCTWEECKKAGLRSFVAVPLRDRDECIGVIGIASHAERDFEPEIEFLETMAGLVVSACLNARLYEDEQRELSERKRAEAALRESELRYRSLVEFSEFHIYILDRSGRYLSSNNHLPPAEGTSVEGRNLDDLHPPAAAARYRERLEEVFTTGQSVTFKHRLDVPDGERWHLETLYPLRRDGTIWAVGGICRDITDRKRAEEALAHERDLLQAVMNGAGRAHLVYLDRDFNFVRVNETYAAECGYRPEEMVGKNHFALYPHAENEAIFRRVRDTGQPFEVHDKPFEFPDQPERGTTWWDWTLIPVMDAGGQVTGLIFSLFETTERKRAEEALRISQQRMVTVMDSVDAFIYIADMRTHELLFVNEYGRRVWGDIMGQLCWKTIQQGQDGPCTFCTNHRLIDANGQPAGVYQWEFQNTVNGRWYDCRDAAIRWTDGRLVRMEIATDITERKRAEEALRQTQADLEKAQAVAQVGSWVSDGAERGSLAWSAETHRIFGLAPRMLDGRVETFFQLVHPEDRPPVLRAAQAAWAGERPYDLEHRIVRPDGTVRWVHEQADVERDAAGKPVRMVGTVRDITARKEAERAVQDSAALYHSLVENLQQSVFRKDREGRFTFANQRFCEAVRRPLSELIGLTDFDLCPRKLAEKYRADDRQVMAGGQALEIEERYQTPAGEERFVQVVKTALRDAAGQIVGVQGVFWDITERKRAEEKMAAQLQELCRWHEATLGRETRVMELKREVNALAERLGEPIPYPSQVDTTSGAQPPNRTP